jgi:actin-like ATPase involved in cell morphogenesis
VPPYRFINEHTGLPARVTAEPLLAVAKGLLICMEHFGQWRRWLQSSEEDV